MYISIALKLLLKAVMLTMLFCLIILILYIISPPRIVSSYPITETVWDTYSHHIQINFNVPIIKDNIKTSIVPNISGQWVWNDCIITNLVCGVQFFPTSYVASRTRFVIYLAGLSRLGFSESHEHGIVFDAPRLPMISNIKPSLGDIIDVGDTSSVIHLNLDKSLEPNNKILFKMKSTEKFFDLEYESSNNKFYKIQLPKENLDYNSILEIDVFLIEEVGDQSYRHRIGYLMYKTPPKIGFKGVIPYGESVKPNSKIRLKFDKPVDLQSEVDSYIEIIPNVSHEKKWLSDTDLELIKKEDLTKNTKYDIILRKGLLYKDGTRQIQEVVHSFKTYGVAKIIESFPNNDVNLSVDFLQIRLKFNQPMSDSSVYDSFYIVPYVGFVMRLVDQSTYIFEVTNLEYNTVYIYGLKSGVHSLYGLDTDQSYQYSFKTRDNVFIMNVPNCSLISPQYCQPQQPVSFSCNIYALKMVLAWKGYNLSAQSIIAEMGYNSNYTSIWTGNPNKVYVGNSDGSWGYGVYWDPTQKILNNRNIVSEIKKNWNIIDLVKEVEKGHPVIIWRYNGTSTPGYFSWIADDGEKIKAINGQHGGVVTGFRGSSNNPTHIHLNDPWFGSLWLDKNTFDYYWSFLDRVGLVIY